MHISTLLRPVRVTCVLLACSLLAACAFLKPLPQPSSLPARLAAFPKHNLPLDEPATIYWSPQHIPGIKAASEADAAVLLGMVHAHLRQGQMELLRAVAWGRVAEHFGPPAVGVDRILRTIDLPRAVPEMEAQLSPALRRWLEQFVLGINTYARRTTMPHPELAMLGPTPEWTVADVLAVSRLASADVNWLFWSMLLRVRHEPQFPALWGRLLAFGGESLPSFLPSGPLPWQLAGTMDRLGSNCMAVAGGSSANGHALFANDAHVGFQFPPLWLMVAVEAPGIQFAGFALPGLPVVVMGRNAHIAWGGTNMLGVSSSLYDLSSIAPEKITSREITVPVRWTGESTFTVRESPLGPVISDLPYFAEAKAQGLPPVALRWLGHEPSHELESFYLANRATHWEEFRQAFASWQVSAQNILYADTTGQIGQLAAHMAVPAAGRTAAVLLGNPSNPDHQWNGRHGSLELPSILLTSEGVLTSTNNTPFPSDPPLSIFALSNDRASRLGTLFESNGPSTPEDLAAMQQDVLPPSSLELAQVILNAAKPDGPAAIITALTGWDGQYDTDSSGAAALELSAYHLAQAVYTPMYGEAIAGYVTSSPAVYAFLREDVPNASREVLLESLSKAAEDFARTPYWRDLHTVRIQHLFGNVPVIGKKFRLGEKAVPGGSNTLAKSAHTLSNKPHRARYGATSRLIADMGNPHSMQSVLFGGQDGYLGSSGFADQLPLWQAGQYVEVPLTAKEAARRFSHRLELTPGL